MVKVKQVSPGLAIIHQRNDILTSASISYQSKAILQSVGTNEKECLVDINLCSSVLHKNKVLIKNDLYAVLAEIWFAEYQKVLPKQYIDKEYKFNAILNSLRYAYAYFFFDSSVDLNDFSYRPMQVKDYYNTASKIIAQHIFEYFHTNYKQLSRTPTNFNLYHTNIKVDLDQLTTKMDYIPTTLLDASALSFKGINNIYRRNGIGAELIIDVNKNPGKKKHKGRPVFTYPTYTSRTIVVDFPEMNKDNIDNLKRFTLGVYDPYSTSNISIHKRKIPLAANFTASYGMWLSKSDFNVESLANFVNWNGHAITKPQIVLNTEYNPNKKIILLLHGLASSPEAWVNVANDILGDPVLNKHYQIWQVYYPTYYPILFNHAYIRTALTETLNSLSKEHPNIKHQDMVIIGHSMGGIIARLMISESSKQNVLDYIKAMNIRLYKKEAIIDKLTTLFTFKPIPQISRAIFLAAPHFGTEYQDNRLSKWLAKKIDVPRNIYHTIMEINHMFTKSKIENSSGLLFTRNSIDSLSNRDPLMQISMNLKISNRVPYHSIMGNNNPKVPKEEGGDGIVLWKSAHLDNAKSELIIPAGHSVQSTPLAIVEIRRILHLHLKESGHK